jgi:hypothetical protein
MKQSGKFSDFLALEAFPLYSIISFVVVCTYAEGLVPVQQLEYVFAIPLKPKSCGSIMSCFSEQKELIKFARGFVKNRIVHWRRI